MDWVQGEKDAILSGFIWDSLPLVEKALDAIDFSRLKAGVKINKFPGFMELRRWDSNRILIQLFFAARISCGRTSGSCSRSSVRRPLASTPTPSACLRSTRPWPEGSCQSSSPRTTPSRMKAERQAGEKKVYIVKLPNACCGIGACVINHPKKVTRSSLSLGHGS